MALFVLVMPEEFPAEIKNKPNNQTQMILGLYSLLVSNLLWFLHPWKGDEKLGLVAFPYLQWYKQLFILRPCKIFDIYFFSVTDVFSMK